LWFEKRRRRKVRMRFLLQIVDLVRIPEPQSGFKMKLVLFITRSVLLGDTDLSADLDFLGSFIAGSGSS
jgi:hypothetical protein